MRTITQGHRKERLLEEIRQAAGARHGDPDAIHDFLGQHGVRPKTTFPEFLEGLGIKMPDVSFGHPLWMLRYDAFILGAADVEHKFLGRMIAADGLLLIGSTGLSQTWKVFKSSELERLLKKLERQSGARRHSEKES